MSCALCANDFCQYDLKYDQNDGKQKPGQIWYDFD